MALTIAARRPERVLRGRMARAVTAPLLAGVTGPLRLAGGRLVAAVDDAEGLQGREGDRKVKGSDEVVFGCFIHGLLFSVTEHMFVR